MKRVATDSVSKGYQTGLFAQFLKILLENVNFDHICSIFNIQEPPSKITGLGAPSKGKCFELPRGIELCEHSTTTKLGVQ